MAQNKLDALSEKVIKYFSSDNFSQPLIVHAKNPSDYRKAMDALSITTEILHASDFCVDNDELPLLSSILNAFDNVGKQVTLVGFDKMLKFLGAGELKSQLINILGKAKKGIVLVYQCSEVLSEMEHNDPRRSRYLYQVSTESSSSTEIVFIRDGLDVDPTASMYIKGMLRNLEDCQTNELKVITHKKKQDYPKALYSIKELDNYYQAIASYDPSLTSTLGEDAGTESNWQYMLTKLQQYKTIQKVFLSEFGSVSDLAAIFNHWSSFDENKQSLYLLAVKWSGTQNKYLFKVVDQNTAVDKFIINLYRYLLDYDHKCKEFYYLYGMRKELLYTLKDSEAATADFCLHVRIKQRDALYYLTDNTTQEKQKIIECLSCYTYSSSEITSILKVVYPELAQYLSEYHFNKPLLDEYFQEYKIQKVTNRVSEEFIRLVDNNAQKRDYFTLPSRSSIIDSIKRKDSLLYFVDALGVEYLGFIMEKCREMKLSAKVYVGRAQIPTITAINKPEIWDLFDADKRFDIKDLDGLKHDGEGDYNYQKTKLPYHITEELRIIREVLNKARIKLLQGECKKIIIASDHGASRLAVIHETFVNHETNEKGKHGGRCCKAGEQLDIPYITEENGYYALANYDLFQGGRKASVETHGGATLEELVVPIIEITLKAANIEVLFVNDVITVNTRKKNAAIILFSKTKLYNVSIKVDESYYTGVALEDNRYEFKMPEITRSGKYLATVYENNNIIAEALYFAVEKEIGKEKDMFAF